MRSDLEKHIEKLLTDKEFKIYFEKTEAKRKIAQEITALRKSHNMTQEQLAREVNTSQQAISRLESPNNKRLPSLEFLDRIAKAFNKKLVISLQN
ncbi:MAG: helix-turn-helix transcriptional regulator [Candidatus Tectomicrobia bacterium]|uniref:Helix-turn-helix transcriptional regulator n=1 Tax=Tectimicrobiota bacterium TaxID=2528274 RepID=A0A933GMP1_UNCTE|nr:helix-turn-helix transcriptional regulator [Candidatus Tectomicrobia bacterium]